MLACSGEATTPVPYSCNWCHCKVIISINIVSKRFPETQKWISQGRSNCPSCALLMQLGQSHHHCTIWSYPNASQCKVVVVSNYFCCYFIFFFGKHHSLIIFPKLSKFKFSPCLKQFQRKFWLDDFIGWGAGKGAATQSGALSAFCGVACVQILRRMNT